MKALDNFTGLTVFDRGSRWTKKESKTKHKGKIMVTPMLAEMTGSFQVGLAGLGSAIGVGLVGMKASEAVGRNPGAFGKVIILALLGMAFAEAIVFYAIFLGGH